MLFKVELFWHDRKMNCISWSSVTRWCTVENVCRTWWRNVCICQARRMVTGLNAVVRHGLVAACLDLQGHCRHSEWNGLKRTFRSRWRASIIRSVDSILQWTCILQLTAVGQLRCAKKQRLHRRLPHLSSPLIRDQFSSHVVIVKVQFCFCYLMTCLLQSVTEDYTVINGHMSVI